MTGQHATIEQARAARPAARRAFEPIADVTGISIVAIGDDYGIKVNVRDPLRTRAVVPTHVDGVPITVQVSGEIRAL